MAGDGVGGPAGEFFAAFAACFADFRSSRAWRARSRSALRFTLSCHSSRIESLRMCSSGSHVLNFGPQPTHLMKNSFPLPSGASRSSTIFSTSYTSDSASLASSSSASAPAAAAASAAEGAAEGAGTSSTSSSSPKSVADDGWHGVHLGVRGRRRRRAGLGRRRRPAVGVGRRRRPAVRALASAEATSATISDFSTGPGLALVDDKRSAREA